MGRAKKGWTDWNWDRSPGNQGPHILEISTSKKIETMLDGEVLTIFFNKKIF